MAGINPLILDVGENDDFEVFIAYILLRHTFLGVNYYMYMFRRKGI